MPMSAGSEKEQCLVCLGRDTLCDITKQLHKAEIRTIDSGRDETFQGGIKVAQVELSSQTTALIGASFHRG
jgi:hypothetical protein